MSTGRRGRRALATLAVGLTLAAVGATERAAGQSTPLRRWAASEHVAWELAPGVFRVVQDFGAADASVGYNAALRLLLRDAVVLSVRYDRVSTEGSEYRPDPGKHYGTFDPGGVERSLAVGLGLESKAGLVGSGLALIALLLLSSIPIVTS